MSASLRLDGMRDFLAALRALPEEMRSEAGGIVSDRAQQAKDTIAGAYPEHTGNLKSHVSVSVQGAGYGVRAQVKNTAKHAVIFENGTQIRKTADGRNRGAMPPGHIFVPVMQRVRNAMVEDLVWLLHRSGFEVRRG